MSQTVFNLVLDFLRMGAIDRPTFDGNEWCLRLMARMNATCTDADLGEHTEAYLQHYCGLKRNVNHYMRRRPAYKMPQLGDMLTLYSAAPGFNVSRHVFLGFCMTGFGGRQYALEVMVETTQGEREVKDLTWLDGALERVIVTKYRGPASRRT